MRGAVVTVSDEIKFKELKEIKDLSLIMKQGGQTPWRYIKRSFECLGNSEYDKALHWLGYAEKFSGIFWKDKSRENIQFKEELKLLKITLLFLIEKFKAMPQSEG